MYEARRQLILHKGAQTFIFRYRQGQEDRLLSVLIECAMDIHASFDWFDVSVLSLTLRRHGVNEPSEVWRRTASETRHRADRSQEKRHTDIIGPSSHFRHDRSS